MNHFSDLIAQYSGYDNAYTTSVETNYYFKLANDGFLEILDVNILFFNWYKFDKKLGIFTFFHRSSIYARINKKRNKCSKQ